MAPQEIGRVFINLLNNAFYAVHERAAVADEMRLEVEGKRPPPNASVHQMLDGARSRFGGASASLRTPSMR